MPLSEITSLQCIAALVELGFAITRAAPERVTLVREGRTVVVPKHRVLAPSDLRVLLFLARVDEADFDRAVGRRRSGELRAATADAGAAASGAAESGIRARPDAIVGTILRLTKDAAKRR